MLNNSGFDLWADEYDKTVGISDEENSYPFAGYKEVLGCIYQIIMEKENAVVLDIGFGTGTLTAKLYEHGCSIYGQDFSARMVELASGKMPLAHLYQADFTQGLAEPLQCRRYDFILATYSLHHLSDNQKITFLKNLLPLLNQDGKIIIGTRDEREILENYDFLQKSFDPSFNPPALVADLQDADEVVIFGHSIGENDRQYFKAFFLQQTNFANTRRKDITIFTRDAASELQIKRSLERMTDWNLSTLYGLNNLQIIKTGAIKEDQRKLYDFFVKHGKGEMPTREFIGRLLSQE